MRHQIVRTANGVTRFNVSKARLAKVEIPLPSLHEQRQLAEILDRFDALVNDLSVGLPAELAARRKQFEYYREQLLSFGEAA
jgi:type I restriction enzyme S subunit